MQKSDWTTILFSRKQLARFIAKILHRAKARVATAWYSLFYVLLIVNVAQTLTKILFDRKFDLTSITARFTYLSPTNQYSRLSFRWLKYGKTSKNLYSLFGWRTEIFCESSIVLGTLRDTHESIYEPKRRTRTAQTRRNLAAVRARSKTWTWHL